MPDPNHDERRYASFYRRYASDFKEDIRVYLELAAKWPGAVLEVGCRTGRVARYLAQAGYEVLAIDTSRPMLERAVDALRDSGDKVRVADFDLRRQPTPERHSVALVTLFSFNELIDVEEQRRFLRHLRRSMSSPGVVALDLFCPLSLARPDEAHQPREVERVVDGHVLRVLDKREMLTPLLERRTRTFSTDGGNPGHHVTHRRFIPPSLAGELMSEAGFGNVQWVQGYDLSTAEPIGSSARPDGPFLVLGEL